MLQFSIMTLVLSPLFPCGFLRQWMPDCQFSEPPWSDAAQPTL